MPTERIGLILSAGASTRWQGEPKALLRIGEEAAILRLVRLLTDLGVTRIRIVVGPHADEIRKAVPDEVGRRVEWIDNPGWSQGRTGSVQAGLAGLDAEDEVILWPVDHPFVAERTLPRLLAAADQDALATWVIPQYGEHGGHPVVLKSPAWRLTFDLASGEPLNRLLPRIGPSVLRVPVDDPGVVVNLNTPDEYWKARSEGLPREEGPWTAR